MPGHPRPITDVSLSPFKNCFVHHSDSLNYQSRLAMKTYFRVPLITLLDPSNEDKCGFGNTHGLALNGKTNR